jgi:hypothetical protein
MFISRGSAGLPAKENSLLQVSITVCKLQGEKHQDRDPVIEAFTFDSLSAPSTQTSPSTQLFFQLGVPFPLSLSLCTSFCRSVLILAKIPTTFSSAPTVVVFPVPALATDLPPDVLGTE